ncbi:late exocytosis, associated with Golgi transport-domain-containing protein [Dunaliella salina]|uniref:Late exocytosis, associated with Golgi transport-domain-containing protein n=1 Tax=Dunaliella salina TaxID=3046 RepID=A0ABQ7G2X4_DUNSA|nr:late exocytosis, associated with Golgi transport-domain-containing protein [Dunaliella salina]|eukprot:KAF5828952.1 late exocytosis, associated with Golgi transport-domain-containing protein [Dunaliella salina]
MDPGIMENDEDTTRPDDALSVIFARPNTKTTDSNVRGAIVIDVVIGAILLFLFVIFQSRSILYKFRLVSPSVSVKPPPLPGGVSSLWAWLVATVTTSDQDLLDSVGLDSLMLVKLYTFGIQLFSPIMILGIAILLPVHYTAGFMESDPTFGNQAEFMRLTTTNVPSHSHVLWLHFVMVWIYIFWGCWLLKWHYHQYVTIRQHWLKAGDDVNYWRALHAEKNMAQPPRPTFAGLLSNMPLLKTLLQADQPTSPDRATTPPCRTPPGRSSAEQQLQPMKSQKTVAFSQAGSSAEKAIKLSADFKIWSSQRLDPSCLGK